ncbi:hypothetical protein GCWU000341_01892, partial [Oribacterium sp. oral taxon 078 str. F0262]
DTGYYAAIIKIDDRAVIAHASISEEDICEISSPLLIDMLCTEILIQEIVKYFMGLPFSVIRLSTPDNGVKLQITVHIMVY